MRIHKIVHIWDTIYHITDCGGDEEDIEAMVRDIEGVMSVEYSVRRITAEALGAFIDAGVADYEKLFNRSEVIK